jgi:hypothetical protein
VPQDEDMTSRDTLGSVIGNTNKTGAKVEFLVREVKYQK